MINVLKEIETDWYLIQLDDTRNFQVWNKWDLFELLLQKGQTIYDDEFPMSEKEFDERFQKMKEIREFEIRMNKQ